MGASYSDLPGTGNRNQINTVRGLDDAVGIAIIHRNLDHPKKLTWWEFEEATLLVSDHPLNEGRHRYIRMPTHAAIAHADSEFASSKTVRVITIALKNLLLNWIGTIWPVSNTWWVTLISIQACHQKQLPTASPSCCKNNSKKIWA